MLSALLALLMPAFTMAAFAAEPARLALLIGNQRYAEAVGPLKNPKNDIALIKSALVKIGFADANITVVSDADRVAMLEAFETFAAKVGRAGPDAISFFYYSGHGASNDRRDNFLIPVDVPELYATGFWHRSVGLNELLVKLNTEAPAAKHFVIFDACRNTLKLKDTSTRALTQPKGFQPVQNIPGGMLIAFATAEGELASDAGEKAGPYARALAEEIVKPGVEAIQVFRETQLRVIENIGQKPWMQASPMARLYFAGRDAPVAPAPPAPPLSEAAQAWDRIKDSKSVPVFEAFRKQYGANAVYDTLAAERIAALKGEAPPETIGPSWWPWSSGGSQEAPPKPAPQTQTAINVPNAANAPNAPPIQPRPEAAKPEGPQVAEIVAPKKPEPVRPPEEACGGGLLVSVAVGKAPCIKPGSGQFFKDCPQCPEMVIAPAGSLTIEPEPEPERKWLGKKGTESPQREVTISKPFAVGRFALMRDEFEAFVRDTGYKTEGGCYIWTVTGRDRSPNVDVFMREFMREAGWKEYAGKSWRSPGFAQTGSHPVVCINWDDAKAYTAWLSRKTGKEYRLLSEAEWEYAARAGTATPFRWGSSLTPTPESTYVGPGASDDEWRQKTVPVQALKPNAWGLYQVHGYVWEWTEDCWHENYQNAPADGSASATEECDERVLRGGSWVHTPGIPHAAYRSYSWEPDRRYYNIGLRVARTLNP